MNWRWGEMNGMVDSEGDGDGEKGKSYVSKEQGT